MYYWFTALSSGPLRTQERFRKPHVEAADLNREKGEPSAEEVLGLESQLYASSLDFQSGTPRGESGTFPI